MGSSNRLIARTCLWTLKASRSCCVRSSPTAPTDVIDALNRGELNHRKGAEPHDDLTILVFGFQ